MITKRHHLIFFSSTLAATAISAASCTLDTAGVVEVPRGSGSSGSTGSSTGGAGGMASNGGAGGIAGAGGGTGGTGGAPCPGMETRCDGVCVDTSTDSTHCGDCMTLCTTGSTCVAGKCQAGPVCTPGAVQPCYTGPGGTVNVGICKEGTQTCAPDGSSWGTCMNEVLPATETCGNALDEDCNGSVLMGSACLVNTNLVVRYFLDEAQAGKGPTTALDSAPTPLDLPITYDAGSNMAYTSVGTGRGIKWTTANGAGVAKTTIDGTKIKTMLDGKQKGTLEVVAQLTSSTTDYNRLLAIGAGGANVFSFGVYSLPQFSFELNDTVAVGWGLNFSAMGRVVLHVVVDTTDGTASNRIKLYVDGMQQQNANLGMQPAQNLNIALGANNSICLGNRDQEGRSMGGSLYYAAIYAAALSAAEVKTNADVLKAFDDK